MTITVLEHYSRGKIADDSYNEDRLVIGENIAAVLDGSRGPGYLETDVIQSALNKAVDYISELTASTTPQTLVSTLTSMTAKTKHHHGLEDMRYSGGFGFVVYSVAHRQIWRVHDCPFRFDGKTYLNEAEVELIASRQRAFLIHAMLVKEQSIDEVMKSEAYAAAFIPSFAPLLDFANHETHDFGFGVINGLPVPERFIQVFDIPDTVSSLILTSDGYPELYDTLEDTEKFLAGMLAKDPLCIKENIASKGLMPDQISYDDRTWLKIKV